MADTNFSAGTIVASTWLDDVNTNTYAILAAVSAGPNNLTAVGASTVTVGYPRGVAFRFIPQAANTGAMTINISGLGAKAITKYGTVPLVAGDVIAGSWAYIAYDGVQFQLINPLSVPTNSTGRLLGVQTFTANGTYTPTAGTNSIVVHAVGGGGAGGGAAITAAGQISAGAGGGSGALTIGRFTSGFSGAAVTIGAGGVPVLGGGGGAGGTTSLGALITAPGGGGGVVVAAAAFLRSAGASGGSVGIGGNIIASTGTGGEWVLQAQPFALGVRGGPGPYGGGSQVAVVANGVNATGFGSGGGGAASDPATAGARIGGGGSPGVLDIYEYS